MARRQILNQVIIGAMVGDAITDQALLLRRWLRELGFISEIYAEHIHLDLEKEVHSIGNYRPNSEESHLILHHSIGSAVIDHLLESHLRFLLIYHNVTPPEFLINLDPALAQQLTQGQAQLTLLQERTDLALADSPFNERDLQALSFPQIGVLPIVFDENGYDFPSNPDIVARLQDTGPYLLFVGRIAPNKKQDDLIKLLYFYRRIKPDARLILMGSKWLSAYDHWLRDLAYDLNLQDHVIFTDHVTQQDMVTYFRVADIYVSMSEHEGFGKPLIESMYFDLPVLAYNATAVPGTLGKAGILFNHKDYEALAEMVDLLVEDKHLRQHILLGQQKRVKMFFVSQIRKKWQVFLQEIHLMKGR